MKHLKAETPDLRAFAARLRDPDDRPPEFEWDYANPDCRHCALGLLEHFFPNSILSDDRPFDAVQRVFGLSWAWARWIFWNDRTPNATPNDVANRIEQYLAWKGYA